MKAFFVKTGELIKSHKILTCIVALLLALIIIFSCLGALIFNRYSSGTVPTDADLATLKANNQVYERVIIFGVDGAGDYFSKCDTPNFDRIFNGGSVTYTALSQTPTISAPNWGSMIHGVRYQKHKISNDIASNFNYSDQKYPSFFKVYAERHPGTNMASICNWAAVNKGIIEHNISGMTTKDAGNYIEGDHTEVDVDDKVCEMVIDYIQTSDPKIMFMQFDSVDGAGHDDGYGSELFENSLKHIDNLIGQIYDAYCQKGWKNNTLFICVSDHGHETWGGHGSNNPTVRYVTVAVNGGLGNIVAGTPGKVVTQDIAAICFYALGEKQYETWECKVPKKMFKGL